MKISKDELAEMKDLVESGDLDINAIRQKYQHSTGKTTTLTDEQLTAAARTEDDVDELLIANIIDIEANGLEIT
jgi:hypothetical protein